MKDFKSMQNIVTICIFLIVSLFIMNGCDASFEELLKKDELSLTENISLNSEAMNKVIKSEISKGTTIDDFVDNTRWEGTNTTIGNKNAIELTSSGQVVESFRKYEEFLKLENYIAFHYQVEELNNIEWMAIYLSGNTSFSDYYEFNLLPKLNQDRGMIVLNKSEFIVGKGNPQWHQISTIKIAFKTKDGQRCTLRFGDIITYAATPMVSIWFDDGWKSTFEKAFPIMKEYDLKGTLSIISSHVKYKAYCSEKELDEMYNYGWDFVNHTENHKNLTTLTDKEIIQEINKGYEFLNNKGYKRANTHFVPPESAVNEHVNKLIKEYVNSSRHMWEDYNNLPITDPYNLRYQEVKTGTTINEVLSWIDNAIENDLYLILLFHQIDDESSKFAYSGKDFESIVQYLHSKRNLINTVPISQVFQHGIVKEQEINDKKEIYNKSSTYLKNGSWNMIWEENFEGININDDTWNIVEEPPHKNNELQNYIKENICIQNGELIIKSTKKDNEYFSGAINTDTKRTFKFGRIDVRARLPSGKGIFPAIWLLPQSGDRLPEIDIIEYLGKTPNEIWHVLHYKDNDEVKRTFKNIMGPDYSEDYHIYSLQWDEDVIEWLIDGKVTFTTIDFVPQEKMFLYINTAIGGDWPGDPDKTTNLPKEMKIDYIRYLTR